MKVDLSFLNFSGAFLAHSTLVIFITTFGKMAVSIATSLYFKMSSHDALAFGLIMGSKGIVELAACSYFYDRNVRLYIIWNHLLLLLLFVIYIYT